MLTIKHLHAGVDGKEILRGIDLQINAGEVHAIMGPNGSGKSTLAGVLAGRDAFDVTEGEVRYDGKDLLEMDRGGAGREGLFLAFQYPVEIPGVNNNYFLRAAAQCDSQASRRGGTGRGGVSQARSREAEDPRHAGRPAQAAGQRGLLRRREEAQRNLPDGGAHAAAVHPRRDRFRPRHRRAAQSIADGVNALRSPDRAFLVITHYQRLLNYIVPDRVHVLVGGRIVESGGKELALELEAHGYRKYGINEDAKHPPVAAAH